MLKTRIEKRRAENQIQRRGQCVKRRLFLEEEEEAAQQDSNLLGDFFTLQTTTGDTYRVQFQRGDGNYEVPLETVRKFLKAATHPTHGLHTSTVDFRVTEELYNNGTLVIPSFILKRANAYRDFSYIEWAIMYCTCVSQYRNLMFSKNVARTQPHLVGHPCISEWNDQISCLKKMVKMFIPKRLQFFGPLQVSSMRKLYQFQVPTMFHMPERIPKISIKPVAVHISCYNQP